MMSRETLLREVNDYAQRLVEAGDMASFEEVFDSTDPDFDVTNLSSNALQFIYDEYIAHD